MSHLRPRQLLSLLDQRLKHFPIVGVLGARQTGKSTLIREMLPRRRTLEYSTLDREEDRARSIRDDAIREVQWDAWIEMSCYRHLAQLDIERFKPKLAPCLRSHRLEPGFAIHPWSAVI